MLNNTIWFLSSILKCFYIYFPTLVSKLFILVWLNFTLLLLRLVFLFPPFPPIFVSSLLNQNHVFFLPNNSHDQAQPKPAVSFLCSSENCWLSDFLKWDYLFMFVWFCTVGSWAHLCLSRGYSALLTAAMFAYQVHQAVWPLQFLEGFFPTPIFCISCLLKLFKHGAQWRLLVLTGATHNVATCCVSFATCLIICLRPDLKYPCYSHSWPLLRRGRRSCLLGERWGGPGPQM